MASQIFQKFLKTFKSKFERDFFYWHLNANWGVIFCCDSNANLGGPPVARSLDLDDFTNLIRKSANQCA